MEMNGRNYWLADDGTMDTVIDVECMKCSSRWTERIDCEAASFYRDESIGELTGFTDLVVSYIDDEPCPECDL